jgi:hypothetical protein
VRTTGVNHLTLTSHSNHNRHASLVHIASLVSGILVNTTRMIAPIHPSFGYHRRGKLLWQIHQFGNKKPLMANNTKLDATYKED